MILFFMIQKAIKNSSNSETVDCYRPLIPKFCEIPVSCRFASGIWKRKLCFWMLLVSTSRTTFLEITYPAQRATRDTYPEYLYTNISNIQIKHWDWVSPFIRIHHKSSEFIIIHPHSQSCQICCLPLPTPGHWKVPSGWQHWSQSLPDTEKNAPNFQPNFLICKIFGRFFHMPNDGEAIPYKIVIVIITIVIRQPC